MRRLKTFARVGKLYLFGRWERRRIPLTRLFYHLRIRSLFHAFERHLERPIQHLRLLTDRPRVRVYVDGKDAFACILKWIRKAQHMIVIQMFIWKDDPTGRMVAEALLRAADRGVMVSISKEALGDAFEWEEDFLTTKNDRLGVWHRFWHHSNIEVLYGHHGDHAKVYTIDDRVLLLTGMNIADEYRFDWHDLLIQVRSPALVQAYLSGGGRTDSLTLVMNQDSRSGIRPALRKFLQSAKRSIVLEHAYLSDPEVLQILARKSHTGVRITIILPAHPDSHHYANMQSVAWLIGHSSRQNLQIFLYPKMLHSKVTLVDHWRVFLGSANLMQESLDDMGEVNLLIDRSHHRALVKINTMVRLDILKSRLIEAPPSLWWYQRILGWLRL